MEIWFGACMLIIAITCGLLGAWLTYRAIKNDFIPWRRVRYELYVAGLLIAGFGVSLLVPFIKADDRWVIVLFAVLFGPVFAYAYMVRTPCDWEEIQRMKKPRGTGG